MLMTSSSMMTMDEMPQSSAMGMMRVKGDGMGGATAGQGTPLILYCLCYLCHFSIVLIVMFDYNRMSRI